LGCGVWRGYTQTDLTRLWFGVWGFHQTLWYGAWHLAGHGVVRDRQPLILAVRACAGAICTPSRRTPALSTVSNPPSLAPTLLTEFSTLYTSKCSGALPDPLSLGVAPGWPWCCARSPAPRPLSLSLTHTHTHTRTHTHTLALSLALSLTHTLLGVAPGWPWCCARSPAPRPPPAHSALTPAI